LQNEIAQIDAAGMEEQNLIIIIIVLRPAAKKHITDLLRTKFSKNSRANNLLSILQ